MQILLEESFWKGVLGVFRPQIILLLTQILLPFSIILIIVIIFLTYFFAKKFIIPPQNIGHIVGNSPLDMTGDSAQR